MAVAYTQEIRKKACVLRENGRSLGEINREMKIPKNTLSGWVKHIKLSEEQNERIRQKIINSGIIGRPLAVKANLQKIEKWQMGIREKVQHYGQLATKYPEIGKLICGLLYLCEGAKYPSSRYMYFGNSDPDIISAFVSLLRKHFNIDEAKLRFSVSHRWDQDYNELKRYWSKITNIPILNASNARPDRRTKGKPTLRKEYMGICRIFYCSTSLQFELQSIGEIIIKGRL